MMSQTLANTIAILIGLVMLATTLIYNYTLVAEHLDDENGWMFWYRLRSELVRNWEQRRQSFWQAVNGQSNGE